MIKELHNVVIDIILLRKLECCEEGIKWFRDNIDIPITCGQLSLIQSDYENYKAWLIDELEAITGYTDTILTCEEEDGFSCTKIYDADTKTMTIKNSDGESALFTYDDNGNVLTHKDTNGSLSKYIYDDNGNVLTYINNRHGSYTKTYDKKGRVLTYRHSDGYSYTNTYDGDMVTTTDNAGDVITKQYKNLDKEFLEEIDRLFNTKRRVNDNNRKQHHINILYQELSFDKWSMVKAIESLKAPSDAESDVDVLPNAVKMVSHKLTNRTKSWSRRLETEEVYRQHYSPDITPPGQVDKKREGERYILTEKSIIFIKTIEELIVVRRIIEGEGYAFPLIDVLNLGNITFPIILRYDTEGSQWVLDGDNFMTTYQLAAEYRRTLGRKLNED